MTGNGRTIYVAGAGIAGLALALALAKFGASVVVLERAAAIQEFGAGLQIGPNARHVLDRMGLDRAIAARSFEPAGIDLYPYRRRRPLTTLTLGPTVAERFGAPYTVMHRADLVEALFRACKRFANIDILFGVRNFDAESHARGISVTVEEADGRVRSGRAFALIGADGVNSRTRQALLGGPVAKYSGYVAWRATLPQEAMGEWLAHDRVSVLLGPGYHAVFYPLPSRRRLNVVLLAREKAPDAETLREPRLPWALLKSARFEALMAAARGHWSFWPLAVVPPAPWHDGAIGLVGDAAHAMLPFQAQGAAMALEDAAILAPLLVGEADAQTALLRFAALRKARVARVARISAANGCIFHLEWPFSLGRDAVIALSGREAHLRRLAWLYGYDPAPEV